MPVSEESVAVVAGLFEERGDGVVLLAGSCPKCQRRYFPRPEACREPSCDRALLSGTVLSGPGTLWSYTIQHYPAPAPFRFDLAGPYGIGVIEFADGLRVLGMIAPQSRDRLRTGDPVGLTSITLYVDSDGRSVRTWALTAAPSGGEK
jgi:uncharacterized OB-fold protein